MRALFITAGMLAAISVVTGCHLLDVSGTSSMSSCPNSAVINAGVGISDFKVRIPKQTAVAPPDSVLDVALLFMTAVTQPDRDTIAVYGGTHVATAGSANTLKAEFKANDLASYVTNDSGRLNDAIIYIPSCTTF
jgi:hypothetical protein